MALLFATWRTDGCRGRVCGRNARIWVRLPAGWRRPRPRGIECDGALYDSARSARDRDRLRQQVLEGLGWRIHRIWSTDWFRDPQNELHRVEAAITQAKADGTQTQNMPPSAKAPEPALVRMANGRRPTAAIPPYKPAALHIHLGGSKLIAVPQECIAEW